MAENTALLVQNFGDLSNALLKSMEVQIGRLIDKL
jgi:hypothetical protein